MANYIDNVKFYEELKIHRKKHLAALESGDQSPPVNDYIGNCLIQIATHYSYKHRFMNYTYREELVGDAIEICLKYINSFDPEKSKNPFSYFTTACHREFFRTLKKEAKQKKIKDEMLMDVDLIEYQTQVQDEGTEYHNTYSDFMRNNMYDEEN